MTYQKLTYILKILRIPEDFLTYFWISHRSGRFASLTSIYPEHVLKNCPKIRPKSDTFLWNKWKFTLKIHNTGVFGTSNHAVKTVLQNYNFLLHRKIGCFLQPKRSFTDMDQIIWSKWNPDIYSEHRAFWMKKRIRYHLLKISRRKWILKILCGRWRRQDSILFNSPLEVRASSSEQKTVEPHREPAVGPHDLEHW